MSTSIEDCDWTLTEIRFCVFHLRIPQEHFLITTFMRLQEFYESSYEEIRGKFFNYEKFLDTYAEKNDGKFNYFNDWEGFNVPGHIIDNFRKTFSYEFGVKERRLFAMLDKFRLKKKNKFYLIGTSTDGAVKHELAHAYYYLHSEYKNMVLHLLSKMRKKHRRMLETGLTKGGYSPISLEDEIQAYMATETRDYIMNTFDLNPAFRMTGTFKRYFEKFDRSELRNFNKKNK